MAARDGHSRAEFPIASIYKAEPLQAYFRTTPTHGTGTALARAQVQTDNSSPRYSTQRLILEGPVNDGLSELHLLLARPCEISIVYHWQCVGGTADCALLFPSPRWAAHWARTQVPWMDPSSARSLVPKLVCLVVELSTHFWGNFGCGEKTGG